MEDNLVVGTGFRAEMEASEVKLGARTCKGKCGCRRSGTSGLMLGESHQGCTYAGIVCNMGGPASGVHFV